MPTLTIPRTSADGNVLNQSDLDAAYTGVETWANTTKLDNTNIQAAGILQANMANNSIGAAQLIAGSVGTSAIAASAVTTSLINANAITLALLATTVANALNPAGAVIMYGGTSLPTGWLWCDGTSYLRSTYADLYAALGAAHGSADGTHFNVPDLRGRFPRGTDNMGAGAAGTDPDAASRTAAATGGNTGNTVGSIQADGLASHSHASQVVGSGGTSNSIVGAAGNAGIADGSPATKNTGGNETRPKNTYLNFIIKT